MDQQYQPDLSARLEKSFEEADEAREQLTESMANSVATNCDLLHHGLVSAKGLEVTTEMYRHMLGKLLRNSSGEVRAQVLDTFNQSMEKFWPRKKADSAEPSFRNE
jgi:hypothetical protein